MGAQLQLERPADAAPAEVRAAAAWWSHPKTPENVVDSEALAAFRDECRARGFAPKTIASYDSNLLLAARRMGKPLLEATTADIRAYIGREDIRASTRSTIHAVLAVFYRFCIDEGYLDHNPIARIRRAKAPSGKPRPFTEAQVTAMLSSGAYRRTRVMISLGYYQGFRVSSIARVHGRDIDLARNEIRTVGKGSKERWLPLHPVIAELATTMPRDDWWFPARRDAGGPIKPGAVSDLIRRAIIRAGITDPQLTAHSLRHSFGTALVEADVDIRVIQELMMHENLSTTQIYTGVSPRRMHAAIGALPGPEIPAHSGRRSTS